MNRFATLAGVLALSASAFAQTVYSPDARFQTNQGSSYAYNFGNYRDGRYQMADGNLRNKVTIITSISYRPDNGRTYSSFSGMGRTFTNVTMHLSDCDIATMTTNLSANATSTPSMAFSGSVTWPTYDGQVSSTGWPITFPCNVWVSNGTADVMADYQFTGGTLANNFAWSSTSARSYYMDGYRVSSFASGQIRYEWNGSTACFDSGTSNPRVVPYNWLSMTNYGPNYRTTSFKNMFRFYMYSYYTAPSSTAIHMLDLAGSSAGTAFPGISCQNLHLAASPVMLIMPVATNATSAYSGFNYLGTTNGLFPYNPVAVGVRLWGQTAWQDSGTGALKLTLGASVEIPALPLYGTTAEARRNHVRLAYPTARAFETNSSFYNPIIKYN